MSNLDNDRGFITQPDPLSPSPSFLGLLGPDSGRLSIVCSTAKNPEDGNSLTVVANPSSLRNRMGARCL
ncbi:hypothetical protein LZ32DRAFT_604476 [Colletotrichum eremochloae]|nr:hypothetical protein LZ32DRAFT_604476 [Colletotrichum eremochloae]